MIVFVHTSSLLVLIPLMFPIWAYLVILLFLLSSGALALHRTGALHLTLPGLRMLSCSVSKFNWDSHGEWCLWTTDGTKYEVDLLPGSTVYSWIAFLNFRTQSDGLGSRQFSLILTEKQLPAHEFRRLRVRLSLQSCLNSKDSLS